MSAGEALKGVMIGSTEYPFDYTYLENKPEHSVPDFTEASEGDVLMVVGDTLHMEWATPESGGAELPTCSTSGWVLTSDTNAQDGFGWAEPSGDVSGDVPDHSSASEGDVLIVSGCQDGHLVWGSPLPTCTTRGWVLTSDTDGGFAWADPATLTS